MEIVKAESENWTLRNTDGTVRVSGTELGRRLRYIPSDPSKFNKKVVERLFKAGKLNDFDVATERSRRKIGVATRAVTEYWLPLPAARHIALMHVKTEVADELRLAVVDELERLATLRAPQLSDPTTTILMALAQGFESLRVALSAPRVESVYIDEERTLLLKKLAQRLVRARGETGVTKVWWDAITKFGLTDSGRVFESVTTDRFDDVLTWLRSEIETALAKAAKAAPVIALRATTKPTEIQR